MTTPLPRPRRRPRSRPRKPLGRAHDGLCAARTLFVPRQIAAPTLRRMSSARERRLPLASPLTGALILAVTASAVTLGADAMWLVAMGDHVVAHGIPKGVPFAAADSSHWVNVPVLAEVFFAALHGLGPLGLPASQLFVDAVLLGLLMLAGRLGNARDGAMAVALALTAVGTLPALGVVRAQLLSLVPFALLLLLLRSEQERPSRRIWLLPLLTATWSNLHGAVLAGAAVAVVYLAFSRVRVRRLESVGVGLATLGSLWLTPAGLRTGDYYLGVLTNEAARRGTELWAPPGLDRPFDVLMLIAAAVLFALALMRRRPLWEYVAAAGLLVGTLTASRHGVWLVLFLATPAVLGLTGGMSGWRKERHPRPGQNAFVLAMMSALVVATAALLFTRLGAFQAHEREGALIAKAVGTKIVLAPEPLVEDLASAGVRVWASNPIDAFSAEDQAAYLDFVAGGGPDAQRALDAADVIVAPAGFPQVLLAERDGFVTRQEISGQVLLERP